MTPIWFGGACTILFEVSSKVHFGGRVVGSNNDQRNDIEIVDATWTSGPI